MFNILSLMHKDKAEGDPLASLKTVTHWLNHLPAGNVSSAHEQILAALVQFNAKGEYHGKDRLDILLQLDEHARPLQAALCQQYLRNPRMSRPMESRLRHAIHQFYREMARAYHGFITDHVNNPAASKIGSHLPLLVLRTLHDFGNIFKWLYFRYKKPANKLWLRLHKLYRLAEFEGFLTSAMTLYPGDAKTTRCVDQYVRTLLLARLDASALYPRQIEMADGWLSRWAHLVTLEKCTQQGSYHFYVALTEASGAHRIRNPDFSESCRCWDASLLLKEIHRTREGLQVAEAPARLGLGDECRLPECLEMLEYAERQWGPLDCREQRKSARTASKKIVDVVHGFNEICATVKQGGSGMDVLHENNAELKYDEMVDMHIYGFVTESTRNRTLHSLLDEREKAHAHERWVMENESEHGFGASVLAETSDWLRLGSLLGLKAEPGMSWKIGVVRRLTRPSEGLIRLGIEVLAHKPRMLLLRPESSSRLHGYAVDGVDATESTLPVAALLVAHTPPTQGELILEAAHYSSGRTFDTTLAQHKCTLRLRDVMETGDGWMRAAVDILLPSRG